MCGQPGATNTHVRFPENQNKKGIFLKKKIRLNVYIQSFYLYNSWLWHSVITFTGSSKLHSFQRSQILFLYYQITKCNLTMLQAHLLYSTMFFPHQSTWLLLAYVGRKEGREGKKEGRRDYYSIEIKLEGSGTRTKKTKLKTILLPRKCVYLWNRKALTFINHSFIKRLFTAQWGLDRQILKSMQSLPW